MVLAGGGLKLQDVQLVETGGVGAALQAVRTGQVDAMVHMEPVMTMLEQKGDVRIISDARSLQGSQEIFGGMMPATCLFAPSNYLRAHPNTVQAIVNATVHALKWLQTAGPSDLIKVLPEAHLFGDRAPLPGIVRQIARIDIAGRHHAGGRRQDHVCGPCVAVMRASNRTRSTPSACIPTSLPARPRKSSAPDRQSRAAAWPVTVQAACAVQSFATRTGFCLLERAPWRALAVRTADDAALERAGTYTVIRWPFLSAADAGILFHSATLLAVTL